MRTQKLKETFLNAQVLMDNAFPVHYTAGCKMADGQPFLIRRAKALKFALENITPVINDYELLVMQKTRYMRGAVPYTSYSQKFFKHLIEGSDKEEGDENTVGKGGGFAYHGIKNIKQVGIFGIHKDEVPSLLKDCEYWEGRCIEDVSDNFLKENWSVLPIVLNCWGLLVSSLLQRNLSEKMRQSMIDVALQHW